MSARILPIHSSHGGSFRSSGRTRRPFTIGSRSPEQDFVCALVFCLGVIVGGSIGQHFSTSIVVVGALFCGALTVLAHIRRLRS